MFCSKLSYGFTCPTGKLTKYTILHNIKQDYLEMQFKSALLQQNNMLSNKDVACFILAPCNHHNEHFVQSYAHKN